MMRPLPLSSILCIALGGCRASTPPVPPPSAATAPSPSAARAARFTLTFVPQSDSFAAAAAEYTRLWANEGERIMQVMEEVAGIASRDTAIRAIVYEGISNSGYRESPMRLRASYPFDTKRATLVHELGHRLQSGFFRREEEEHGPLFLWLYDAWVRLWGKEFADAQVAIEKPRADRYQKAWDDALALTQAERAAAWRKLVAERLPTRR